MELAHLVEQSVNMASIEFWLVIAANSIVIMKHLYLIPAVISVLITNYFPSIDLSFVVNDTIFLDNLIIFLLDPAGFNPIEYAFLYIVEI